MQNQRQNYKVYMIEDRNRPADKNGEYFGVKFKDGYAFVNWEDLGEEETYKAIQSLGSDGRFEIVPV